MSMTRIVVSALWGSLMVLGSGGVSSQNFPNKPIRMVGSAVGGSNDVAMAQRAIRRGDEGEDTGVVDVGQLKAPYEIAQTVSATYLKYR